MLSVFPCHNRRCCISDQTITWQVGNAFLAGPSKELILTRTDLCYIEMTNGTKKQEFFQLNSESKSISATQI